MNYKAIGRILSQILLLEAVFMLPSVFIGLWDGNITTVLAFVAASGLAAITGLILKRLCRNTKASIFAKEGVVCVAISWIVISLFGCLPFWFSKEIPLFVDAFFEIVSGFTTTGASILSNVEGLTRAALYWRSFSHWLGGMGVLVFLLAIAPSRGGGGFTMHLLRAESPGPDVSKLVPRMRSTATILYLIYIVLTIANLIFLLAGGMSFFDAVCTAFGTAGTGGFGTKNDSLASFSPYLQNVCTVFMWLFGINFTCFYLLILRQFGAVWRNEELRLYCGTVVASIVLIVWNLQGYYNTFEETVRHVAFQVSSIITTTGFASDNFDLWPNFSKAILIGLMVIGACAGSTGGGLKCARVLILFKSLRRSIRRILHPQNIQVIRMDGHRIEEKVVDQTNIYMAAYSLIIAISFLLISLDGFSITTNLTAVLACFNNIGPGLEAVGPAANFADYSVFSKLILILNMLAGRLEIFPILALMSRSTWKEN